MSLLLLRRVALPFVEESAAVWAMSEVQKGVALTSSETHVVKISAVATTRRLWRGQLSIARFMSSAHMETYSDEV